uniref:Uncharacterized protein n=1 Tax=Nelumbo nucifera TaxID=4432 RepID=A0A822YGV6_NELNU|nr:TPA_asm: hypothetical protein HUJ06_012275 [Nelumbo nucifera]
MAEYSYMRRGYATQEESRQYTITQSWGTRHNGHGVENCSDGWREPNNASNCEGYRKHPCPPVIVDAEGRRAVISSTPNHYSDSNCERYQKQSCPPVIVDAEGRREAISCTPNRCTDRYAIKNETREPKVYTRPVVEYRCNSPTKMRPTKNYEVVNNGWGNYRSPSHDRPPEVENFFRRVQTEVSQPNKVNLVSSKNWHQTQKPNDHYGTSGYGGYGDNRANQWNKPSGNTIQQPQFDGSYGRSERLPDTERNPAMITSSGWNRPSHSGWATSPSYNGPLTRVTNDIGTAIDYLRETRSPFRYTHPV